MASRHTGDSTADASASTPDLNEAQAIALRYLGRREYAAVELVRKLQQRDIEEATAWQAIEALQAAGLQSDTRFAEAFVRQRVGSFNGPIKIRAQLRQRGLGDALIEQALGEQDTDWHALAADWAARKHRGALDEKQRARLYRGGRSRGFSHDQIMRAIDRLRDSA